VSQPKATSPAAKEPHEQFPALSEAPAAGHGLGVTRRQALSGVALLGLGAGLDHVFLGPGGASTKQRSTVTARGVVPFYGTHQAGIATRAQEYLFFASFDLTSEALSDLRQMLHQWTVAAAALSTGELYEPNGVQAASEPPTDTGEAVELDPAQLTLTFGFGPSLFQRPRLGLRGQHPAQLKPLPAFQGEGLQPERSGGDLCIQACSNDPQVAFHAIHVLSRIADGTAVLRWTQLGFGRTSSTTRTQSTPRNLMGFKDGTDNIRAEDTSAMNQHVWVQPGDGPAWMTGGTYLVARRIKILFDVWDATSLEEQQRVIGRYKLSGAPLGGHHEYDPIDLQAESGGEPVIPRDAHIRLASPSSNGGERILRRGYSFCEAPELGSGSIEAGLFFIAFQRDPGQFITIQRRLAGHDALNRHTLHTSSAVFACPPGSSPGAFVGEQLLS
jgi:deferrochelatase/peroxidase EfeB